MNIIFDKALKQKFWQMIKPNLHSDKCPFCDKKITAKNFAGAMWVGEEFRAFDGNIFCLLEVVDEKKKQDLGIK